MAKKYTKEEFWKLYEKLPEELKDAIFAEDTANSIGDICSRYEIAEEKIPEIAEYVGHVLLGVLPPGELQKVLEKEVGLEKEKAKRVAQEIHRYILFPVKASLEELYKIEMAPAAKPVIPEGKPPAEGEERPKKPDVYREPIE